MNLDIPNNWQVVPFKEIIEDSAFGPRFSSDNYTNNGDIATLRTTDLDDHGRISYETMPLASLENDKFEKHFLKNGDLIISRSGTCGIAAVFEEFHKNVLPGAFLIRFRLIEKAHPYFYRYFFNSEYGREHILSVATGAVQQNLNITNLETLSVPLPPKQTQERIVSKISAFDDLIENNTRRIEILEEMARRIYREWFVHFRYPGHQDDPSTSSGQRLVDSGTDLGEVPEGWEVKKLEDVADINPENISTDYKGEIEYINISGVNEGSVDETEMHDFEEAPGRAKRRVKHGDIIWSSVRPNLKAYALILNPPANQIASTGFAVIRPKKLPASFLYNFSTTEYFVQYLVNHTRGSAYPAVNVSDFKDAPILVPDEKLVEKFDEITWSNFQQIDKLSRKNKKLKETRDLLLPKLISGKVGMGKITVN